jgi:DNA-binding response OmpR family regulator
VEICKDINPDVILLDRQLQNTETYDVIRQIVTLQPNKCVIVLAEDSASDDKDILLKLGCKEFLVKPVTGNVLLETVKKYFHNY